MTDYVHPRMERPLWSLHLPERWRKRWAYLTRAMMPREMEGDCVYYSYRWGPFDFYATLVGGSGKHPGRYVGICWSWQRKQTARALFYGEEPAWYDVLIFATLVTSIVSGIVLGIVYLTLVD